MNQRQPGNSSSPTEQLNESFITDALWVILKDLALELSVFLFFSPHTLSPLSLTLSWASNKDYHESFLMSGTIIECQLQAGESKQDGAVKQWSHLGIRASRLGKTRSSLSSSASRLPKWPAVLDSSRSDLQRGFKKAGISTLNVTDKH